jgi:hypothetical protein
MADSLLIVAGFFVLLGLVIGYVVFRFLLVPWNRATLLRSITRKNYVVVGIRRAAGQILFHVVNYDPPFLAIGNKKYEPDDRVVNYIGSIPYWVFPEDDVKPLNLSTRDVMDKYRDPQHLDSLHILLKGLIEAKLSRDKKLMLILAGATLAGLAIVGYINYLELQKLDALAVTCAQNGSQIIIQAGTQLPR